MTYSWSKKDIRDLLDSIDCGEDCRDSKIYKELASILDGMLITEQELVYPIVGGSQSVHITGRNPDKL